MSCKSGTHQLRQLINNVFSALLVRRSRSDLIHGTYYLAKFHRPTTIPFVITVFDMIHERFPEQMAVGEEKIPGEKKRCMQQADRVICISEHTRNDVIELAGIPKEKITVIHLGSSFSPSTVLPIEKTPCASPFLLYVGNRGGVKNFIRVLRAYGQSARLSTEFRLLCFGGGRFTPEELLTARDLGLDPEQLLHVAGDDRMLAKSYTHATALIYPSLYEGFGLPILEAMACDCPVLCSNTSSMPEVAGEAALFFDPLSVDEITACMETIVYSTSTRQRLVKAGRRRLAHFSWDRCAEETVKVYKQCL